MTTALFCQEAKRYSFVHYSTNSGLASNQIVDVRQDEEGYIWIGTSNGLQRFDGVRFITFRNRKNDPSSLPANFVGQLMMDRKNNLWVQVGGLKAGIFDRKNFTFREAAIKPSREQYLHAEKKIVEDEAGNIMMLLWNTELLTYNETRNEFSAEHNFVYFPTDWKITGFANLPGTKKYVIGMQKGIAIYNLATNQLSYSGHNAENEPLVEKLGKITGASEMIFDRQGRLWFNSWETGSSNLYAFDTKSNEILLRQYSFAPIVNSYYELRSIVQQRNGDIWIKGLNVFGRFLEKEKRFEMVYNGYESEQSIAYTGVATLFEDREGNMWVGTDMNGLYRFNPREQLFTNVRQVNRVTGKPGDGGMMSFVLTKQGSLLAGAWGDGMYRFDQNFKMIPLNIRGFDEKGTPSMWSMCASRDSNRIWIGAQPGIWIIDQARQSAVFHSPAIMKDRTVRQVAEDRFGNLWIGTQSLGVFKWDAAKGKSNFDNGVTAFPDIPPQMVVKIMVDRKGQVWICTASNGVYVIDPATDKLIMHFGTSEPEERRLPWDAVPAALQYDDTTIVIVANSISIFNTEKQRITRFIPFPDLVGGGIAAVERDRQGYLWMSSTSGIYRVNLRTRIFIQFDRTDGIANDRFVVAASYVMPDGKILFGADNQFLAFDPSQMLVNDIAPEVKITGFRLGNDALKVDSLLNRDQVELSPKDNSITIEFSGLRYNNANLIRYKLERLDKDWKVADRNNEAIYSYLPPGKYTFLARSEDAEGNPGKTVTRLVINVNPPFWKTWWFFCLVALLIAAVFYWLDKQRINKLIALQNVRSEIAFNLHEEVNTTLNNINVLSEMARIKADRDIERSKEFIDQISAKSHNMIIAMDDILWSIDPQNDSMEKSLLRMMEFADALKNRHGAQIEIALDKRVRSLRLDMKTRLEVFLIFKEALRTIVEYSGGRATLVHIDLFKNKLSVKLQDATASLDKNVAEIDNSIKEMNARSAMINADIDVQLDKKGIAIVLLVAVK